MTIDTYGYEGTTDSVVQDVENQAGVTVNAALDALGDRLASGTSGGYAWLIPDLHGNVVGQLNSSGSSVTDAFRYDAYGLTEGTVLAGSIPSPWRFQGKLLESTSGGRDLYDFEARSYSPDIGAFTSLDSVAGSATNPVTLDRYLYAGGNPETLIDPDGHVMLNCPDGPAECADETNAGRSSGAGSSGGSGGGGSGGGPASSGNGGPGPTGGNVPRGCGPDGIYCGKAASIEAAGATPEVKDRGEDRGSGPQVQITDVNGLFLLPDGTLALRSQYYQLADACMRAGVGAGGACAVWYRTEAKVQQDAEANGGEIVGTFVSESVEDAIEKGLEDSSTNLQGVTVGLSIGATQVGSDGSVTDFAADWEFSPSTALSAASRTVFIAGTAITIVTSFQQESQHYSGPTLILRTFGKVVFNLVGGAAGGVGAGMLGIESGPGDVIVTAAGAGAGATFADQLFTMIWGQ